MVRIHFHGGVEEIGGNKLLLEDRDIKIWLDFGMCFSRYKDFFEEYMSPRTKPGIRDYVATALIPDMEGLYAPDLLEMAGRDPEEPDYDAALISHPHDDHVKYLSFLHPDIPVYMGETCKAIRETLQEMESGTIDNRVISYKRRRPDGSITQDWVERDVNTFRTGDTFTIGHVEIEPIHVDHSIPGSYGFIIHTSEGPVVYSGDLRKHGRNASMTEEFVSRANEVKPEILLSEGTRITDRGREHESEERVEKQMVEAAKQRDRLVVIDYSYKDVDRFNTIANVARETGRKLVIGTKAAHLYQTYDNDPNLSVPALDSDLMRIHLKQKRSFRKWEKEYKDRDDAIEAVDVGEQEGDYLLALNQWTLNELIDVHPKGGLYIRSISEPFNEETQLDEERVDNWVDHFGMEKIRAHCSGHAPGGELKEIVNGIDADTIIPIHTEEPGEFTDLGDVTQPEMNGYIQL